MPAKKYRVFLNGKKRSDLGRLVNTGTDKARKHTRARILLRSVKERQRDNGSLGSKCRNSGSDAPEICGRRLQGALNEKPRPGRPPKFTGREESVLAAIACSEPPEGYGRWTIRLITDKLVELSAIESISGEAVRKHLKKGVSSHGLSVNGA